MEMLRKIAPATVCGKIEKPTKVTKLFTVYGEASRLKPYKSTYGDGFGLVGNFEAVNIETGEVSRSAVCFLPEPFMSMAVAEVQGGAACKFALTISVKPADNKAGYEYISEPLHEVSQSDVLAELRALAGVKLDDTKALPAPAKKKKK